MKFSKKVFKNGLRVVTVPMKDNPTVTVLVLVETGSKYETKKINGISHFLEHMCFKGTVKRPKAIDISKELDALGSQYNAFTAQEYTGYFAKSDARHFRQIFDVVSDIYLNSTFPEAEMQKEKGVIIDFYADWCIPCKELDASTFADPNVINLSKDFISLKANMTKTLSPDVEELREKYNIVGVPTVLIINSKGEEVKRITGYVNAKEFADILQEVK